MSVPATPTSDFRIVPVLCVADVPAAVGLLGAVFGFAPESSARVRRGDQIIELMAAPAGIVPGHGPIDHLALAVGDADAAMQALLACGGQLDAGVTPDGPLEIAAFWENGVRYVFFTGPDGAHIELCAQRGVGLGDATLRGHDHIGISCRDIAASEAFYTGLGMRLAFSATLDAPAGQVPVRFLRRGGFTVELYSPPELRAGQMVRSETPLWHGLRFEGAGRSGVFAGPDGERIELLS